MRKNFFWLFLVVCTAFWGCQKDKDVKPALPDCTPRISYRQDRIDFNFLQLDSNFAAYRYSYDGMRRPTVISSSWNKQEDQRHKVQYDAAGRVSQVNRLSFISGRQSGVIEYKLTYNAKNQLSKVTQRATLEPYTLEYTYEYDEQGNCTRLNTGTVGGSMLGYELYEYSGNTIKATQYQMHFNGGYIPSKTILYEFDEREDKLHYFKAHYFIAYGYSAGLIFSEGLNQYNYMFNPVYRFSKKMIVKTTTANHQTGAILVTCQHSFEYNSQGYPSQITTSWQEEYPRTTLPVIEYNCN